MPARCDPDKAIKTSILERHTATMSDVLGLKGKPRCDYEYLTTLTV